MAEPTGGPTGVPANEASSAPTGESAGGAAPGGARRALAGQVGLVTGAGRGIGRDLALGLAAEGMAVGLLGRARAGLEETLRTCAKLGTKAVAVPADVTRPDSVRAAVETVERDLGPLELVVNNAGRIDGTGMPAWQVDAGDWWTVVETNLRGPFNVCRAVLPGMVSRGAGRIVNVNSGFGTRPVPDYSAYAVSKGALSRLTDNLAGPLAAHGVTVFDVSPGAIHTDMTAGMPMFAHFTEADWTPVERVVALVGAIAAGRCDPLTGRFLHAGRDDLADLLARAEQIRAGDGRTVRLVPYGPDDPLS